jgi:hypothetical protein
VSTLANSIGTSRRLAAEKFNIFVCRASCHFDNHENMADALQVSNM